MLCLPHIQTVKLMTIRPLILLTLPEMMTARAFSGMTLMMMAALALPPSCQDPPERLHPGHHRGAEAARHEGMEVQAV